MRAHPLPTHRGDPWRRFGALLAVLALLVATACSDDDDGADRAEEGATETDGGEDVLEGDAPGATGRDVAYRVDAVEVDGEQLELTMTVAARSEVTFDDDDVRLVTNAGVDLPRAEPQRRTIPAGSVATLTVTTDGLTEPARTVEVDAFGMSATVELPDGDGTHRWRPAPLRQMAFEGEVMRDRSGVVVVPYTVRAEGLITEVTFLGISEAEREPEICRRDCRLEDGAGNTYASIGEGHEFTRAAGARVRGTMRFLGAIPEDQTDLLLVVDGWSGSTPVPNPNLELSFRLPSAADSELAPSWSPQHPDDFEVGAAVEDAEVGLRVELGDLSFHEDRIQLDVTATNTGDTERNLDFRGSSVLRDSAGYEHRLAAAAGGGDLTVAPGATVEMTLVFLTPLAPGTSQLDLELSVARDVAILHTIPLTGSTAGDGDTTTTTTTTDDDTDGDDEEEDS